MCKASTKLIDIAIKSIEGHVARACAPAVLVSFGKDSMVMLGLLREAGVLSSVQIITVRHPHFPDRYIFADSIIDDWHLDPLVIQHAWNSIIAERGKVDLLGTLRFGKAKVHLPVANMVQITVKGGWSCALDNRLPPDLDLLSLDFDYIFIGSKATDVDPVVGKVHVAGPELDDGNTHLIFPLREWDDEDVWTVIRELDIPYDSQRYVTTQEAKIVDDCTYPGHPEYLPVCTACVNPAIQGPVICPKNALAIKSRAPEIKRRTYSHGGAAVPLRVVAL